MSTPKTLLVATDGQAVLRSHDDGTSWRRIKVDQDLEFDDTVRCLLPDPRTPHAVFAGAETGLFRSEDCGVNWHRIDCLLNSYAVWRLVADARNPNIMYAGTGSPSRAIFFRSRDGGRQWERTSLEMPPKCAGVSRPRMLAISIDPDDAHDVWVGVEEGGLLPTIPSAQADTSTRRSLIACCCDMLRTPASMLRPSPAARAVVTPTQPTWLLSSESGSRSTPLAIRNASTPAGIPQ